MAPLPQPPKRTLAVEYLPLAELTLDPLNARLHKPAQINQIARSIAAFHFNVPVLVDAEGKVLAGHGRVLACRQLGWSEVPVIRLAHLTPAQARAFAIADNRLSETSSWDETLLANHLKELSELDLDFSLEATGFTVGEIDLKIQGLDIVGDDDPDEAAAPIGPQDEPQPKTSTSASPDGSSTTRSGTSATMPSTLACRSRTIRSWLSGA